MKSNKDTRKNVTLNNSVVIEPCHIDESVILINSVIGPNVSIGVNTIIRDSIIKNSEIKTNVRLDSVNLKNSKVGDYSEAKG